MKRHACGSSLDAFFNEEGILAGWSSFSLPWGDGRSVRSDLGLFT
jgi:hypothetical protein